MPEKFKDLKNLVKLISGSLSDRMSDTYEEYPSLYPTVSEESIKENSEVESETINLEEKSVESDCDQIVPDLTKRNLVEIEDETDEKKDENLETIERFETERENVQINPNPFFFLPAAEYDEEIDEDIQSSVIHFIRNMYS